ncbi:MAG TPA: protease modulator HflC [Verrucomicrobiae bacterium]|jgi:membrane protease subunit HflC
MKQNPVTLVIGALLLVVFFLLLFVFQVRQSEVAVITTFGKATGEPTGPGAHFKWPWPIQKVHKFDQRIQNFESKFEQVLTADEYSLLLQVYVGWTINDPKVFFPSFNGSTSKAEESLEGLIRNAYSGVVGKHAFSHFISTDEKELKFVQIEQEMLQRIQADARAQTNGIDIKFLGIKKIGLPESVTQLVFERMKSGREVQVSKIQGESESQAILIRSAADLESAKLLNDAEAQALRIQGEGDREAANSYQVFKQDPELAIFLLKLKALEQFLKERTTLILDRSTVPIDLLNGGTQFNPKKPLP